MLADPLRSVPKTKGAFVEPRDCLPVPTLPEGSQWVWEIRLDGYGAVGARKIFIQMIMTRRSKKLLWRITKSQP
jgi:hypothetical protein